MNPVHWRVRVGVLAGIIFAGAAGSAQIPMRPGAQGPFGAPSRPSAPGGAGGQPATPPAGLIVGRVIDALSNRPIGNAIVSIASSNAVPREVAAVGGVRPGPIVRLVTNDDGRFAFSDLGDGLYIINAAASGYLTGAYGQRRPQAAAQPFILGKDQRIGNVTIRLWQEATIAGTIADEAGEPVVGATVSLLRRSETTGRWPATVYASGRTDDRGAYRISGLLSGRFFVVVSSSVSSVPLSLADSSDSYRTVQMEAGGGVIVNSPARQLYSGVQVGDALLQLGSPTALALPPTVGPAGTVIGYRTTFYPNASTSVRATPVVLTPGEERAGIDIQVRPTSMVQLSGYALGPDGPEANLQVRLVPAEVDASGGSEGPFDLAVATTNPSGAFTFLGVPSGSFVLKASKVPQFVPAVASAASWPARWAETPVAVGESSLTGVTLQMRVAPEIRGRLEFEGSTPRPAAQMLQSASLSLTAADGRPTPCCPTSHITATGEFTIPGFYLPGKYYPNLSNIPGWYLKSVTAAGRDVLSAPLTIDGNGVRDLVVTLVDRVSELGGRVIGLDGKIDGTASVLMFPADYAQWVREGVNTRVVRLSRPSPQTGVYSFLTVVPGDYYVLAAPDDDLPLWQDPAVIEAAARAATPVSILPGEKKALDLTVRPLP